MELNVVFSEGADKVIGMVIPVLNVEFDRIIRLVGNFIKFLTFQLLMSKFVKRSYINFNWNLSSLEVLN